MMVTLSIIADDLKLYQVLEKYSEKYDSSYSLQRESNHFELKIKTDNLGELIRRLNLIKDSKVQIEEIINTREYPNMASVNLTKTNIDALIGKQTVAQTEISPADGGLVKLLGELWFSRPEVDTVISKGSQVQVLRVEGVSLIIEEVIEENV
jgi:hypothetical protein